MMQLGDIHSWLLVIYTQCLSSLLKSSIKNEKSLLCTSFCKLDSLHGKTRKYVFIYDMFPVLVVYMHVQANVASIWRCTPACIVQ